MLKKHLFTCTAVLTLLVMAKVFASHTTVVKNDPPLEPKAKVVAITTPKHKDEVLMTQLSFADEALPIGNPRVVLKMKHALNEHSFKNLQTHMLHKKAAKWFRTIEPLLAAYGIPEDFKYIPLVESGLVSGTSPKGASGFWQFMPQTARLYGLKVNAQVDERKNIRKSTIAACKYLRDLYKEFDSWTLVAAAYNVGSGKLRKQIYHQNQDNYFMMKLNRETGSYVYKLISMKEIVERPQRYGYYVADGDYLAYNN